MKSTKDHKRHVMLSWLLLEWKLMYYMPELVDQKFHDMLSVDDEAYDRYEVEYLKLCKKLGEENTIVHKEYPGLAVKGKGMMEIDLTRPSVRLILTKYGVRNAW